MSTLRSSRFHRIGLMFPALLWLALAVPCGAQKVPVSSSALTNRDIWTLAEAGFSEEFIIDAIQTSRTQFDISAPALAEMVKHAVTERIVRAMMSQETHPPAPVAVAVAQETGVTLAMPSAPREPRGGPKVAKPAPVNMALSSNTPYYEWKSYFWGLMKRRVGVGTVTSGPTQFQVISPQLGSMYQRVRMHDMPAMQMPAMQLQTMQPQTIQFISPAGYPTMLR